MQERSATRAVAMPTDRDPILVVDDDPDILALVESVLSTAGHTVLTAADGQTALTLARKRPPAAVVLDLMLPDVGGEAVAQTLRAWYGPTLPIVILSASRQTRQAASALGILAYLDKPFDVEALVRLVEHRLPGCPPEVAAVWQAAERLLTALRQRGAECVKSTAIGVHPGAQMVKPSH
jgi:DNA-binding response OmpR family regulator